MNWVALKNFRFMAMLWLVGVSQVGWPCGGDSKVTTTCRFMEEVRILHFSHWSSSWVSGSYATSRSGQFLHK